MSEPFCVGNCLTLLASLADHPISLLYFSSEDATPEAPVTPAPPEAPAFGKSGKTQGGKVEGEASGKSGKTKGSKSWNSKGGKSKDEASGKSGKTKGSGMFARWENGSGGDVAFNKDGSSHGDVAKSLENGSSRTRSLRIGAAVAFIVGALACM